MLDEIDRKILDLIQANARLSNAELGERVGLAPSSVHTRVKRLEHEGVILGYHAQIAPQLVGKGILAFMRLSFGSTETQSLGQIKTALRELCAVEPDILECHNVAGEDCYVLKLRASDTERLEELITVIRNCARSSRSVTSIVLSTFKESCAVRPFAPDDKKL